MFKHLKIQWGQTIVLASIVMILVCIFTIPNLFIDRLNSARHIIDSETLLLHEWQLIDYVLFIIGAILSGILINRNRQITVCIIGFCLALTGLCLVGISYRQILSNGGFGVVSTDDLVPFIGHYVRPLIIPLLVATKVFRFSAGILFLSCAYDVKSKLTTNQGLSLGIIASFVSGVLLTQDVFLIANNDSEVYWFGLVLLVVLTLAAFAAYYIFLLTICDKRTESEIDSFPVKKSLFVLNAVLFVIGILVCRKISGHTAIGFGSNEDEAILIGGISSLSFFLFSPLVGFLTERSINTPFRLPIIGSFIIILGIFISTFLIIPGESHLYLITTLNFFIGVGFCFIIISLATFLMRGTAKEWLPYLTAIVFLTYKLLKRTISDKFILSYESRVQDAHNCLLVCGILIVFLLGAFAFEYRKAYRINKLIEEAE